MKRRNVQQAFVGEGDPGADVASGIEALVEGDEAVDIQLRGGKIMVVVPAGTPDQEIFNHHRFLGGELILEDGSILSFTIEDEPVGVRVSHNRPRADIHTGLSSIPDIPGGV
jgi:hypothetical protein